MVTIPTAMFTIMIDWRISMATRISIIETFWATPDHEAVSVRVLTLKQTTTAAATITIGSL